MVGGQISDLETLPFNNISEVATLGLLVSLFPASLILPEKEFEPVYSRSCMNTR